METNRQEQKEEAGSAYGMDAKPTQATAELNFGDIVRQYCIRLIIISYTS
jgi:hypothetical protein